MKHFDQRVVIRQLSRHWFFSVVWLVLLNVPAVWYLTSSVFLDSDDGILHLFRLYGLHDAIRQGVLYPRWFPDFAFGYGHAVLNYYGPTAYYIAEVIHLLGVDFPTAIKWTFALGYFLSSGTLYLLARRFASRSAAFVGAVSFTYFPYHLVETYQRGALAEHLAWVFLPLILWSVTPPQTPPPITGKSGDTRIHLAVFAVSTSALIYTHSLTAMMFLPFALLYAWWMMTDCAWRTRSLQIGVALAIALGLSAFYWLPVFTQNRWVELSATAEGEGYTLYISSARNFIQETLLFDYSRPEGYPDHPLGFWNSLLLAAAIIVLLYAWWRKRLPERRPLGLFIALSVGALFMTIDLSLPIWQSFHALIVFLQFPWRFMVLVGLGVSIASVFVLEKVRWLSWIMIPLLMVVALANLRVRPFNDVHYDLFSMWKYEFRTEHIGSTWTEEYMPWWVDAIATEVPVARKPIMSDAATIQAPRVTLLDAGYTFRRYRLQSDGPTTLRWHQFYFPQWQVTLDGQPLPTYPSTNLGLLSVDVPSGTSGILEFNFGSTLAEQLGVWGSLAGAFALLMVLRRRRFWMVGGICLALGLGFFVMGKATMTPVQHIEAQFGDLGDLVAIQLPSQIYHPGDTVTLRLTWLARTETRENFKSFVHLVNIENGNRIAQLDGDLVSGYTPTTQWRIGEIVEDPRILSIPPQTPPGTYQIVTGLYRISNLQNLAVHQAGQIVPDGRLIIGEIQVNAR